jgi:hypothetical protein
MLAERPFLLRSSKDLAQKLATLRVLRNKKIWLVSGDIVAFYPTVPTDRCIEIVKEWWLTFVGDSKSTAEKHIFLRCLRFALQDLICDFMDETYLQVRGLAMGVACSPDLANLYAAYFEEKVLPNERFLFFGRFIDDVLGVVVADSEQEALQIASIVSYESVKLDWSMSEWQAPFLDLLVYIDPVTNQVEHKPFRKARNNLERIPWASHHPTDVKKGTFISEMSRLATLSSKPEHYLEALKDLASLYVIRGYPVNLVKHWLKEYTAIQWRSKLGESSKAQDVFVLKSRFNGAWSLFNVHVLGQTVISSWLEYLTDLDAHHKRLDDNSTRGDGWNHPRVVDLATGTTTVDYERRITCPHRCVTDPEPSSGVASDPSPSVFTSKLVRAAYGNSLIFKPVLDIRKLKFHDREWLVSRRRNRNLFDVMASLRKSVLRVESADMDVVEDNVDEWE